MRLRPRDIVSVENIRTQFTLPDIWEQLFMAGLKTHYSARDIKARILSALQSVGLDPEQNLTPEQLGALDHFHTGGFKASRACSRSQPAAASIALNYPPIAAPAQLC
jgi:hypothetical protein